MLIEPEDMPPVPGACVPVEIYLATRHPAPLAGMAFPSWQGFRWNALADLGIGAVACLTADVLPYDPFPLTALHPIRLQDLHGGLLPGEPAAEEGRVRRAAEAVLAELGRGRGVVVHCEGGTGRTGTVIGCVLRGLGHDTADILAYLDRVNKARGVEGWPESGWQASMVEAFLP